MPRLQVGRQAKSHHPLTAPPSTLAAAPYEVTWGFILNATKRGCAMCVLWCVLCPVHTVTLKTSDSGQLWRLTTFAVPVCDNVKECNVRMPLEAGLGPLGQRLMPNSGPEQKECVRSFGGRTRWSGGPAAQNPCVHNGPRAGGMIKMSSVGDARYARSFCRRRGRGSTRTLSGTARWAHAERVTRSEGWSGGDHPPGVQTVGGKHDWGDSLAGRACKGRRGRLHATIPKGAHGATGLSVAKGFLPW
jgi:hypothetical protein